MKYRRELKYLFTISMLIALTMSLVGASADGSGPGSPARYDSDADFVPGEIIVGLTGSGAADVLAAQISGQVVASIDVLNAHLIKLPPGSEPTEVQIEQAIASIQSSPDVAWAEPNYIGHITIEPDDSPLAAVPNDPERPKQWALQSSILNMYNAWDLSTGSTSANKSIAVLDTGVDLDHPDLNGKLLTGRGWDFVNNDSIPQDDHGHGSHVSGIAAAETNNLTGIAGVAWQNKIIPVKVCNSLGSCTVWDVSQGMVHAVLQQATVINLSLAFPQPSMVVRAAADFAWRGDVVVVAAAGNSGSFDAFYPAAFDSVVSVASTNMSDSQSSFSTYHNTVEISAPGGTGGTPDADDIYSANNSGGYMYLMGTSMAAPQVAGAVALYRSRFSGAPAARVRACLRESGDEKGAPNWDADYGWGRLDVQRLLNCIPRGNRVLIDNTHTNIGYSANDFRFVRYYSFAADLESMGYVVSWTQFVGLNATSLNNAQILILADPHAEYTVSERADIANWIRNQWNRKIIAFCEWGLYSDNSEMNTLLSQIGSGIQCPAAVVTEPDQYYQRDYWPLITYIRRTERFNTGVFEAGMYAGTYLQLSPPAQPLAFSSPFATASSVSAVSGQVTEYGPENTADSPAVMELTTIAAGQVPIAARAWVGSTKGRVLVIGDSDVVGEQISTQGAPNNALWIDNMLGGWIP